VPSLFLELNLQNAHDKTNQHVATQCYKIRKYSDKLCSMKTIMCISLEKYSGILGTRPVKFQYLDTAHYTKSTKFIKYLQKLKNPTQKIKAFAYLLICNNYYSDTLCTTFVKHQSNIHQQLTTTFKANKVCKSTQIFVTQCGDWSLFVATFASTQCLYLECQEPCLPASEMTPEMHLCMQPLSCTSTRQRRVSHFLFL